MEDKRLIDYIIQQLLEVQHGTLWMGDTFDRKINSITEKEAFIQPLPGLHSPAQLIARLTAWRRDAILKIINGKGQL